MKQYVYPWEEFYMNEELSYYKRFFGFDSIVEVWEAGGGWINTWSMDRFATANEAMMDMDIRLRNKGFEFIEPHEVERFKRLELLK